MKSMAVGTGLYVYVGACNGDRRAARKGKQIAHGDPWLSPDPTDSHGLDGRSSRIDGAADAKMGGWAEQIEPCSSRWRDTSEYRQ